MDNRKFEEFNSRFYEYVNNLVSKIYADDHDVADDITQEVFIKVFKSFKKGRVAYSDKGWITKITFNEIYLYEQKNKKHHPELFEEFDEFEHPTVDISFNNEHNDKINIIKDYISSLKNNMLKKTIELYYFKGLSAKEISFEHNVPIGTTLKRLSDFRKKIVHILKKRGILILLCLITNVIY